MCRGSDTAGWRCVRVIDELQSPRNIGQADAPGKCDVWHPLSGTCVRSIHHTTADQRVQRRMEVDQLRSWHNGAREHPPIAVTKKDRLAHLEVERK